MVEGKEFRELMLQVVRTRMAFRRSMQRTLKKNNAGITFEMLQILSCLWHEQGITQQVLAERTAKDKACLTNLMNNLEKKGYVHRKEDPEDRRNKLVFLTPEGEEFKKQIRPILDQVYVHAEHIIGIENVETMLSKSRKTKRDGCEKRNAFIETKTKCASNLIRKVTAYLQNQSKTPSLYIKINGIQMDF